MARSPTLLGHSWDNEHLTRRRAAGP